MGRLFGGHNGTESRGAENSYHRVGSKGAGSLQTPGTASSRLAQSLTPLPDSGQHACAANPTIEDNVRGLEKYLRLTEENQPAGAQRFSSR